MSFFVMLNVSRVMALLFSGSYTAALCAFLISSAAGIFSFNLISSAESDDKGVPPLVKRSGFYTSLHVIFSSSVMIVAMGVVDYALGASAGAGNRAIELSPIYFISLVAIHPAIEETVFRGLYYKELRNLSPVFAMLLQGVMFALCHDSVGGMFYALIGGVILGALVENTGRVWGAVTAHAAINLRSLLYTTVITSAEIRNFADLIVLVAGLLSLIGIIMIQNGAPIPMLERYENNENPPENGDENA